MQDKKPLSVRVLITLYWLRVAGLPVLLLMYVATGGVVDETERSVAAGMRQAIIDRFEVGYGYSPYEFGRLLGNLAIPVVFALVLIMLVRKRKFIWVIVFASIDLLIGFASGGFPITSLIGFILILTNPTRNYLKRKNTDVPPPAAPIDYEMMNK
jgi:hypothetical protein